MSKYTVKINDGNKEVDETVEIDTEKETETFHIADNGDTSPTSPGEVDIVYDFKKVSDSKEGSWAGRYHLQNSLFSFFHSVSFSILSFPLTFFNPFFFGIFHSFMVLISQPVNCKPAD